MKPLTAFFLCSLTALALKAASASQGEGRATFLALAKANDGHIHDRLTKPPVDSAYFDARGDIGWTMAMAASYGCKDSSYYHDASLIPIMSALVAEMASHQLDDGLYDQGNLDSPPDTAFLATVACKAQALLEADSSAATQGVRDQLRRLILKAADGIASGGIHTPNHRWEVSACLAEANALYPSRKLSDRIEQWLAEGIDIDSDGMYAERSPHYTAAVVNPAILNLAVLLHRPSLLGPIRKNLETTLFLVEPNGDLETVASRRQDQSPAYIKKVWDYYIPYRYLAIADSNSRFSAMAEWIQKNEFSALTDEPAYMNSAFVAFLLMPELQRDLPAADPEPTPTTFSKLFPLAKLARQRNGAVTATIFGGNDRHTIDAYGSGLSTNPSFFKMRKGAVVLEAVRMTPGFFSTGFFYSDRLEQSGGVLRLGETRRVAYHLPLPREFRRPDGIYALTPDGRYYSKLDFPDRPSDFKELAMAVSVEQAGGGYDITFDVSGRSSVPVTIELTFRSGGTFTGVEPMTAPPSGPRGHGGEPSLRRQGPPKDSYTLKAGSGTYTVGTDHLTFGPGTYTQYPGHMESETLLGSDIMKIDGQKVYLTGRSPLHYTLALR